jgi:hypothetical protein
MHCAVPDASATIEQPVIVVLLEVKPTVPVGEEPLTVAVKVTDWPTNEGLRLEPTLVDVVAWMLIATLTVWLSTFAVALPAPPVAPAVNVEVACPLVVLVLVGLSDPSVAPKATLVPSGTLAPLPPFESCVRSAVKEEVPLGRT